MMRSGPLYASGLGIFLRNRLPPPQDLLAAIEPELLENNYTLQAFTWVPPSLKTAEPTDVPHQRNDGRVSR